MVLTVHYFEIMCLLEWWWYGGGCKPYCICRKIKTIYYTFKHGKNA